MRAAAGKGSSSCQHLCEAFRIWTPCSTQIIIFIWFQKNGIWQSHYNMYKSDIKMILAPKTCSQKNLKSGSDPLKRLAESQTSANLVQSLSYSEQSYGLNWFIMKHFTFSRISPETHGRFWVWAVSLDDNRAQSILQEALLHTYIQIAIRPVMRDISDQHEYSVLFHLGYILNEREERMWQFTAIYRI